MRSASASILLPCPVIRAASFQPAPRTTHTNGRTVPSIWVAVSEATKEARAGRP